MYLKTGPRAQGALHYRWQIFQGCKVGNFMLKRVDPSIADEPWVCFTCQLVTAGIGSVHRGRHLKELQTFSATFIFVTIVI
jgi:hypothetical protein